MVDAWDWTCGHKAGAMCAQCYRELAHRANELAADNERLRQRIDDQNQEIKELREQQRSWLRLQVKT
jgi:septal ring factor EnvC (AmiA/AmiB activator)